MEQHEPDNATAANSATLALPHCAGNSSYPHRWDTVCSAQVLRQGLLSCLIQPRTVLAAAPLALHSQILLCGLPIAVVDGWLCCRRTSGQSRPQHVGLNLKYSGHLSQLPKANHSSVTCSERLHTDALAHLDARPANSALARLQSCGVSHSRVCYEIDMV
jgi:hypothetical protein